MRYTLHGSLTSPFVRKARCVFGEKAVPHRLSTLDVLEPPANFATLSPLRRIPILSFDDHPERPPLPDSSSICAYLEAAHPTPPLLSADPYERAWALWLEEYCDTDLAYRIGFSVTRPILRPTEPPDHAKIDEAIALKVAPLLAYLDDVLGDREWFVADRFGLADIALWVQLIGLDYAGKRAALASFPRLASFLDRTSARPVMAVVTAADREAIRKRLEAWRKARGESESGCA